MDNWRIFKDENSLEYKVRPYFNHSVEFKKHCSVEERMKTLEEVGWNVFFYPAEMVTGCDLLSDSGTTTMTNQQWASMHYGDESYGGNKGYFLLRDKIKSIFGDDYFNDISINKPNAFIFHQGRSAEYALFASVGQLGQGLVIPSNGHFDTTKANIEINNISPINLFSKDLRNNESTFPFKGNMDTDKLKSILIENLGKVPVIYLTVTNNTGGGQPVSMQNIKEVAKISHTNNIPFFLDACRFAENAWFIKNFEEGYKEKSIKDIVKEMFSYVDGFTVSFKKDGLSNMGGGLFIKQGGLFYEKHSNFLDDITNYQIGREGNPSYGGMSGRDIMSLVEGLDTVVSEDYLNYRVRQVQEFGDAMTKRGIPILTPVGGHAVYMDVDRFFEGTDMKPENFGGISFTALLLGLYGHRACELGHFAFGSLTKDGKDIFPDVNFVRFAVPRLRYEKDDLESVAESVKCLYDNRDLISGVNVISGKELPLRHFKARFVFK
ncbi:tryptophanase [bacterium]|nr:tryptophanase [bacterium]